MATCFYYCKGTNLEKADILYRLVTEVPEREDDDEQCLDVIGKKDKNLRIVIKAMFEFAVVYSSLHQMAVDPDSQHYKQMTVVQNSSYLSRFIKFKDFDANQYGIIQLIFQEKIGNETITK